MKTEKGRCYKSKGKEVRRAVFLYNLMDDGECGSGTVDAIKDGEKVLGGYIVKKRFEKGKKAVTMGWGAALASNEFCVYLRPRFRKMGLASKILKRAKKDFPKHYFCPWSDETLAFFEKRKVKITKDYL